MIDGGEDALAPLGATTLVTQEGMDASFGIEVRAHDLTPVVEAEGLGSGARRRAGIGVIDRGEDAVVQQKAANRSFGIGVRAYDLAAVVDAKRPGFSDGIRVIDGGEDTFVQVENRGR